MANIKPQSIFKEILNSIFFISGLEKEYLALIAKNVRTNKIKGLTTK
jgi:hypothetical protein